MIGYGVGSLKLGYYELIKMPLFHAMQIIDSAAKKDENLFRTSWEQTRLICAYQSVAFSGGKVEPEKLFKFDWERKANKIVTIDQIFSQMGIKKDGSK